MSTPTHGALLVALLTTAAGCSGDVASPDVGPPDTFVWDTVPIVDAPPQDSGRPPVDATPAADLPPAPGDAGAPDGAAGRCAAWSAWTCDDSHPVLLCQADCPGGPLGLSCINSGDCVCGVATASCGQFSGAQPCDVCRKAVESGCCNP